MITEPQNLNSCIYTGWVRHRRFVPIRHEFRYRIYMLYLDLSELDKIFRRNWFWSTKRPALAWFRRADHLGDRDQPLDKVVRQTVADHGYSYPQGPIRLLTQLRYFGYVMNPVSFYYCYDESEQLQNIVADVSNTPWRERHTYVMGPQHFANPRDQQETEKEFHVSPFLPMSMQYRWSLNPPQQNHVLNIENYRENKKWLDVTMNLQRRAITNWRLNRLLISHPWASLQIIGKIYWQAIRLKLKGAKFYPHPDKQNQSSLDTAPVQSNSTVSATEATDFRNSLERPC